MLLRRSPITPRFDYRCAIFAAFALFMLPLAATFTLRAGCLRHRQRATRQQLQNAH